MILELEMDILRSFTLPVTRALLLSMNSGLFGLDTS